MGDIMKDATGIAMAIIGVAIIYTLVKPGAQTSAVIGAVSSGFTKALGTAMGGGGMITNSLG